MATILDLLMALNRGDLPGLPSPAQPLPFPVGPAQPPLGGVGPNLTLEPEQPPTAPADPLDQELIARYANLQGQAPTPPVPRGRLERIMNAIGGFGAGIQGQGGQFLQQLQEPQRRYEAQLQDFNQRGAQLGLRGLEAAEDKRDRSQQQRQRAAERAYEREFDQWAQRAKLTHDDAREVGRQAFELQKIRETERIADEKIERQQKAIDERQRRAIENDLRTKDGAPPAIAKEVSEYNVGMRPSLSAAAEKWRGLQAQKAQAQIARLGRLGAGGGGTRGGASSRALKVAQEIQSIKDKMVEAEARGDKQTVNQLITRAKSAIRLAARFPEVEAGFDPTGKWPWVKLRGQQGSVALPGAAQPAAQAQNNDPLGIR